jgi:transcription elongation factor GreA
MATVARSSEPITRRGHARLREELGRLAAEALLAEPEDRAELEHRVDELELTLQRVTVVEPPEDPTVAGMGRRVVVHVSGAPKPVAYELVGPAECDPVLRRISIDSPVGGALVGRRAGETVEVETPGGRRTVEVVEVGEP